MATLVVNAKSFLWPVRHALRVMRRRMRQLTDGRETKQLSPTLVAEATRLLDFRIWLDTKDEQISEAIITRRGWESHVTHCLHSLLKPGMTYLDIGANVGFHMLTGAHLVKSNGRVHAIEMSPRNCLLLKESIAANNYRHVTLHETAVSFEEGTVRYCVTPGTSNCSVFSDTFRDKFGDKNAGFVPQDFVPMTTIDKLIPEGRIDVVKIDVEGYELNVFRGMQRVLREARPTIVLEFFPSLLRDIGGVEPVDLLIFLRQHGYQFRYVLDLLGPSLTNEEILTHAKRDTLIDLVASPTAA